jgi:uncharacterized protein YigE (DUF2233 family)
MRKVALLFALAMGFAAGVGVSLRSKAASSHWQRIADGLEYRRLRLEKAGTAAHVLRVDMRRCRLRVVDARQFGVARADAKTLAEKTHALGMVNGGFFGTDGKPLGLIISDGKQTNRFLKRDWGVFLVTSGRASIVHTRDYKPHPRITQALQVGPRLVVNGQLVKLKPQSARRTALGVMKDGRVALLVSEGELRLTQLAETMRASESQGGLDCPNALHLDGGPSSQMFVNTPKFQLNVAGGWGVPNGVGVLAAPQSPAHR